jgi:hypothetical protein
MARGFFDHINGIGPLNDEHHSAFSYRLKMGKAKNEKKVEKKITMKVPQKVEKRTQNNDPPRRSKRVIAQRLEENKTKAEGLEKVLATNPDPELQALLMKLRKDIQNDEMEIDSVQDDKQDEEQDDEQDDKQDNKQDNKQDEEQEDEQDDEQEDKQDNKQDNKQDDGGPNNFQAVHSDNLEAGDDGTPQAKESDKQVQSDTSINAQKQQLPGEQPLKSPPLLFVEDTEIENSSQSPLYANYVNSSEDDEDLLTLADATLMAAQSQNMEVEGYLEKGRCTMIVARCGPRNAADYLIQSQSQLMVPFDKENSVDLSSPDHRLGEQKKGKVYLRTYANIVSIQGIVWKRSGLGNDLDAIKPKGPGETRRFPQTLVLIKWLYNGTHVKSFETRTTFRRICPMEPALADKFIYEAAARQIARHEKWKQGELPGLERSPTPFSMPLSDRSPTPFSTPLRDRSPTPFSTPPRERSPILASLLQAKKENTTIPQLSVPTSTNGGLANSRVNQLPTPPPDASHKETDIKVYLDTWRVLRSVPPGPLSPSNEAAFLDTWVELQKRKKQAS